MIEKWPRMTKKVSSQAEPQLTPQLAHTATSEKDPRPTERPTEPRLYRSFPSQTHSLAGPEPAMSITDLKWRKTPEWQLRHPQLLRVPWGGSKDFAGAAARK